ncbi:MAG: 1-deoxy-D-xylulose-5-phosphate reductoisomerase [Clostridiales bacterium]|nr:1-deoxy-D-xylulose-5-phosphate reductoisomerase [Clostridiales bacterium]
MKKIAVLGCTGSIGTQTLDIVRNNRDKFEVTGLSCGTNVSELAKQAIELGCKTLGIADESKRKSLIELVPDAHVFCGDEALTAIIDDADIVVVAVVGMIGLKAVLAALDKGKTVALANKESLVAGGAVVKERLNRGGKIYPVDSEHSAVWQCLQGEKEFKRIILTASGGPFYFSPKSQLQCVTPEQAISHPNWKMGKKISVDSATMMNKGLEIIEASWLFDTTNIDYVIHPESVVHSMVEFIDGSIKAQACTPDMRMPIQYALTYPNHEIREYSPISLPLDLRFLPPDEKRFPAPRLAQQAMKAGGTATVVLNAANEAAVRLFLDRKIAFTDIVKIVESTLNDEKYESELSEDIIFQTHKRIYDQIYLNYRGK